jgi:hypothetical protein
MERFVTFEVSKVAISDELSGTVFGVQLAAVFQSPLVGLLLHVALPASLVRGMRRAAVTQQRARPGFPKQEKLRRRNKEVFINPVLA